MGKFLAELHLKLLNLNIIFNLKLVFRGVVYKHYLEIKASISASLQGNINYNLNLTG